MVQGGILKLPYRNRKNLKIIFVYLLGVFFYYSFFCSIPQAWSQTTATTATTAPSQQTSKPPTKSSNPSKIESSSTPTNKNQPNTKKTTPANTITTSPVTPTNTPPSATSPMTPSSKNSNATTSPNQKVDPSSNPSKTKSTPDTSTKPSPNAAASEVKIQPTTSQSPSASTSEDKGSSANTPATPKAAKTDSALIIDPARPIAPLSITQLSPNLSTALENFNLNLEELYFPPEKNGVKILDPQITYAVDQEPDQDIVLSDIIFNNKTFQALSGKVKDFAKNEALSLNDDESILYITAPQALGLQGEIEVLSENGTAVFSKSIQKENLEKGSIFAQGLGSKFWNAVSIKTQTHILFISSSLDEHVLNYDKKSGFKFCWSKKDDSYFSRYCTPYYRYSKKEQKIIPQTQAANTKVIVETRELQPKGEIDLGSNQTKRILLTSAQGFSIEFKSKILPLNLSHYFLDDSGQWIYIIGHSNVPVASEVKIFPHIDPESLKAYFSWQSTIGNIKDHWVTIIPRSRTFISALGQGGGIFRYPLKIEKVPSFKTKLAMKNPLRSTYSSEPTLRGRLSKNIEITAIAPSRLKLSKTGQNFLWQFKAPDKGSENINSLTVKEKTDNPESSPSFLANYSIFRGYSTEVSMRLAGAMSADYKINYLGEFAYNQWFESLFGWEHPTFSHQHWGVSLKHFQPLNANETAFSLQLTTFDLKYRFSPGLWERDESWGLIFGAEDVTINDIHGTFGGAGIFWARSMPKLFDVILNWVPFMRYPKWVDMEMMYYLAPLAAGVTNGTSPTYSLNFHGKLLWTKYFFGEAGFGLKAYSYLKTSTNELVSVQALYGTAGLGFNF